MATFSNIPELVKINGKWTIEPFTPTQPAFDWKGHKGKRSSIYVLECASFVKMGISTDFEKRFKSLDLANPFTVQKVAVRTVPLAGAAYAEAWLHKKFADYRVKGEWFACSKHVVIKSLEQAIRRAKAYEARCEEWHNQEQIEQRSLERTEKGRRELEEYLERNPHLNREEFMRSDVPLLCG